MTVFKTSALLTTQATLLVIEAKAKQEFMQTLDSEHAERWHIIRNSREAFEGFAASVRKERESFSGVIVNQ